MPLTLLSNNLAYTYLPWYAQKPDATVVCAVHFTPMTHPLNSPHALSASAPFRCFALAIWCASLALTLSAPPSFSAFHSSADSCFLFSSFCSFYRQSLSSAPDGNHCQFQLLRSLSHHVPPYFGHLSPKSSQ